MAFEHAVDLSLRVVRTDARVHGTVVGPAPISERFDGWLDLTAAIARVLDAVATTTPEPEETS
jgi:hypothetical protein